MYVKGERCNMIEDLNTSNINNHFFMWQESEKCFCYWGCYYGDTLNCLVHQSTTNKTIIKIVNQSNNL